MSERKLNDDLLFGEEPDPEIRDAAEPVEQTLADILDEIDTPEKAEAVIARLVTEENEQPAMEVAPQEIEPHETEPPEQQLDEIVQAVKVLAKAEPDEVSEAATVLKETAAAATVLEGPAYEALVDKVQKVTDPALQGQPERLEKPRRYLRDALMHHPSISFIDKYDARLFILINSHAPRNSWTNEFFRLLSLIYSNGLAWIVGTALFLPFYPGRAAAILKVITLPIWVAALIVEGPVKKYFRRRRPFIAIVRAIVIGKKPGNWSFPSGHSAVAFAGARMMERCLPRWRPLWYFLASLVGFSRIYLGAHYPGDVISGSVSGVALAEATRWLINRLLQRK